MLDLTFNNFTADRSYGSAFFKKIFQKTLDSVGLGTKNVELSINLAGESRIRTLNKKYRGKDKATDVLSFPLNEGIGAKTATGGIIALGDVFICLPIAERHALKEGGGLSSELALLAVHGLLHLLGYEHEKSAEEAEKMFKLQDKILKSE
jgi:probable rRNA maturation factor